MIYGDILLTKCKKFLPQWNSILEQVFCEVAISALTGLMKAQRLLEK